MGMVQCLPARYGKTTWQKTVHHLSHLYYMACMYCHMNLPYIVMKVLTFPEIQGFSKILRPSSICSGDLSGSPPVTQVDGILSIFTHNNIIVCLKISVSILYEMSSKLDHIHVRFIFTFYIYNIYSCMYVYLYKQHQLVYAIAVCSYY